MTTTVEPISGHAPAWVAENTDRQYWLWAPRPAGFPLPESKARKHWAGCWQSKDGEDGSYDSGDTLDSVLATFPPAVADAFRAAVNQ